MEQSTQKKKLETIFVKVKPKNLPVTCPTCRGFGSLKFGAKICNGCNGKTYILVETEEVRNEKTY